METLQTKIPRLSTVSRREQQLKASENLKPGSPRPKAPFDGLLGLRTLVLSHKVIKGPQDASWAQLGSAQWLKDHEQYGLGLFLFLSASIILSGLV